MIAKKVARLGTIVAVSLILGLVENMLPPIFFGLPYARLGLSNIALIVCLIWFGLPQTFVVLILKCVLLGLLAGTPSMIPYSLLGGSLSILGMYGLLRLGLNGLPAISSFGGILHNIGQIFVAMIFTGTTAVVWMLPYLMLFGSVAGFLIGILAYIIVKRIKVDN